VRGRHEAQRGGPAQTVRHRVPQRCNTRARERVITGQERRRLASTTVDQHANGGRRGEGGQAGTRHSPGATFQPKDKAAQECGKKPGETGPKEAANGEGCRNQETEARNQRAAPAGSRADGGRQRGERIRWGAGSAAWMCTGVAWSRPASETMKGVKAGGRGRKTRTVKEGSGCAGRRTGQCQRERGCQECECEPYRCGVQGP